MKNYLSLFFAFFLLPTSYAQTCNPTADSLQLIALHTATNGTNWFQLWDLTQPVSTWRGVTLNSSGCVQELELSYMGLSGNLIDIDLPFLEFLDLSGNQITGTVLDFSNLPSLTNLIIESNQLSGSIPNFSALPLLTELNLNNNDLTGNIPDFSQIPLLEELDLSNNQLDGPVLDFTSLPQLRLLIARSNLLTGSVQNYANMPNLRAIDLSDNLLTGNVPNFTQVDSLQYLNLRDNQLTGGISDFSQISKLGTLDLSLNQLTGPIPDFSSIPELRFLKLGRNQLTGFLADFSNLPILQQLLVDHNQLTGTLPAFSNLPELNSLNVMNNALVGKVPDLTALCPKLGVIEVWVNEFTHLPDLNGLNRLRTLYTAGNYFSFDDLIPNKTAPSTVFRYRDQKMFGTDTVIPFNTGDSLKLHFPIDSFLLDNTYTWYKNGQFFASRDSNSLWMYNLVAADSGYYTCEATNPALADLTLYLDTLQLVFQENACGELTTITPSKPLQICKDSIPDLSNFSNSGVATVVGTNYAYLITDTLDQITAIQETNIFDLNDLSEGAYRIYGLSYQDSITFQPGDTAAQGFLGLCDSLSSNYVALSVINGIFQANFTVSDSNLQVSLVADSIGLFGSYIWDLGDGNQAIGRTLNYTYPDYGQYEICLISSNLCKNDTSCTQVDISPTSTAISSFDAGGLRLYPNPAQDQLYIGLETGMVLQKDNWNLYVQDLQGRHISVPTSYQSDQILLDIHHLPPGVYFCIFRYKDRIFSGKWMK